MILEDIIKKIQNAKDIVLLTHEAPDGDAIGSSLALYNALKKMNKDVEIVIPDCPTIYQFLEGYQQLLKEGTKEKYDLAIALDSSDIKRLNGFAKFFETARTKIVIDHHSSNTMFGDYNFVNPVAPACAQIIIVLLEYLNVEIDKEIGEAIATGIITDTGGLQYSTTTPETFEFIAELLRKGVNISNIYRRTLKVIAKKQFDLRNIASNKLELLENGKIAFTYVTKEEQDKLNITTGDHEGIVELGRDIEGVEVSIFLREQEENVYKVAFRSNDYVNVADICLMFNGGGHPRAAGCTMNMPLQQAKEKLITETKCKLRI